MLRQSVFLWFLNFSNVLIRKSVSLELYVVLAIIWCKGRSQKKAGILSETRILSTWAERRCAKAWDTALVSQRRAAGRGIGFWTGGGTCASGRQWLCKASLESYVSRNTMTLFRTIHTYLDYLGLHLVKILSLVSGAWGPLFEIKVCF